MADYFFKFRDCEDGKLHAVLDKGEGRIKLTANLEIFVRKDGDDTNDGLTDSAEGAFLTIGAAVKSLMRFDAQGYTVTVTIHKGTYEEMVTLNQSYNSIGYSKLILRSFDGEQAKVIGNENALKCNNAQAVYIDKLAFNIASTSSLDIIYIYNGAEVHFSECTFGPRINDLGDIMCVWNTSKVFLSGTNYFSGPCRIAINVLLCSSFDMLNSKIINTNVKVSTAQNWQAYVACCRNSHLHALNFTHSGTVTGKRYFADCYGVIQTGVGSATFFPGTVAGTVSNGFYS